MGLILLMVGVLLTALVSVTFWTTGHGTQQKTADGTTVTTPEITPIEAIDAAKNAKAIMEHRGQNIDQ